MSGRPPAEDTSIDSLDGDEIRVQAMKLSEEMAPWRAKLSLILNAAVQYELDRVAGNDGIEVIASVASMTPASLSKLLAGDYRPTLKTWTQIERILMVCQPSRGVERLTAAKRYFERITELSEKRDRLLNRRVELARRSNGGEIGKGAATGPRRLVPGPEPSTVASQTTAVDPAEGKQAAVKDETVEEASETEPPYPPPAIPDLLGHEQRPDPLLAKTPAKFVAAMRAYHVWAGSPSYREMERRCAKQISYSTFRNMLNSDALPKLPALEIFVKVLGGSAEDLQAWATAWRQITMGDFKMIGRERKRPRPENGT
ncbi:hypothetical protein GCM10029978_102120 [Actinoallomurus acanthiterrae]